MGYNLVQKDDGSTAFVNEDSFIGIQMFKDETVKIAGVTYDATELAFLDGVTAGTVTASKALVVDASKDISALRTMGLVNLDAGSSGVAGTVDIFPATASKGKLSLECTNQTGDTAVTINANAMGQATTVNIADPGIAASYAMQSTAAITVAEADVLSGVTPGTVTASKALVVDASKDLAILNSISATSIDAGASGSAGSVDIFPATESKGKLSLVCDDQTGDTTVTLSADSMGQETTVTIGDPGVTAASFALSTAALTLAEVDVLDAVTPGTVAASKAVVVDASKDISAFNDVGVVNLDAGSSGVAGTVDVFPTTESKGKLSLVCTDQTGDTAVTINANAMGQATTINVADPGVAASYAMQSTAAITLAEADVLSGVTPGTVAASKAMVADSNLDIASVRNAGITGTLTHQALTVNPVIWVETTVGFGDVASAAQKTIQASSGTIQYKVREIWLSAEGTNFSGGGGDRLLNIQDSSGTSIYTSISAAVLQSLAQGRWDSTEVPAPATAADFLAATVAGEDLVATYSGGSTDYTAGSLTLLIQLEKVAV